jgi:acetyl-CoA carboxylase carboxyltransferase component
MNCKDLGADLTLAWTRAEMGIMGAEQAVGIVHRRQIEHSDDPAKTRQALANDYGARHLGADRAAKNGYVDEVILPSQTRDRFAWALSTVRESRGGRGATRNIPL